MVDEPGRDIIYRDLLERLRRFPVRAAASDMGLRLRDNGQVEIPMLGRLYLLEKSGVTRTDGKPVHPVHGSVLAGYIMYRCMGESAGRFVPLDQLTKLVPAQSSYSGARLESRLARSAGKDPGGFAAALARMGARPGGETGSGGRSWIIELLPKLPVQVVLYPGDAEFPATCRLLFDLTATNFLEFEYLAVLATVFVDTVGGIN